MTQNKQTAKKIIITGGISGIGLAMARAFAGTGAHLVLGGIADTQTVNQISAQMDACGAVSCVIDSTDISDATAARQMAQAAIASMGGVDVLINNAGIQHVAPVEQFPPERWQAVIDVNLSAPFHLSAVCLPEMRAQNSGRIINIASVHGQVASANKSAYVAAKHGLIGLTKTIALEMADTQVTCNAICPGWVRTPLVEAQIEARAAASSDTIEEAAYHLVSEKQPTGRFMRPEQIASMALFLAGKDADNVTGTAFTLDGGWTAQ